jgi:Ner family transcriptional regulator
MDASTRKNISLTDWHPADIKAALEKKGYSFARIAREYGYVCNSPNKVLTTPWSHMERIVAKIIGVRPATIWPSRYDRRGRPLKERTARVKAPGPQNIKSANG